MTGRFSDKMSAAIANFKEEFFDDSGILKPECAKLKNYFFKLGLIQAKQKAKNPDFCLRDDYMEILQKNVEKNKFYEEMFIRTFTTPQEGLKNIFALILGGDKCKLPIRNFDPIKNKSGENKGIECCIIYKEVVKCQYSTGNGSMHNTKNQGHTFLCHAGVTHDNILPETKFSVVHKMDGRYIALYIFCIQTDSGPLTLCTIHSRGGMIVGSGIYLAGPEEELSNFTIEWAIIRKKQVIGDDGKKKYVDDIMYKNAPVTPIQSFEPGFMIRQSREEGKEPEKMVFVSQPEVTSAYEIGYKLKNYVKVNEVILVNCEGTKDNMRPLYDKHIAENQSSMPGLFVHPFGTIIYPIVDNKINVEIIKGHIPIDVYQEENIQICTILKSPKNQLYWNIEDINEGMDQSMVTFTNDMENPNQKAFNLVKYANNYMMNILSIRNDNGIPWDQLTQDFPGHITEGVIVGIHRQDGTFAYIKVKDENFADDEEKNMKLEML